MAIRSNKKKARRRAKNNSNLMGMIFFSAAVVLGAVILRDKNQKITEVRDHTRIVAEFDTVELPVPARYVEAGTKVSDIPFKFISFPAHQVPEGALLDIDGLDHARNVVGLPAKLPLFPENLSLSGAQGNAVIDRIPNGMRAITIRVDATTVVEGWAGSGAIVDVLLVEDERTTVVAEQVKILSCERSVSPVAGESKPAVPSTVTLLVSKEQALAISTAMPRGRITFALRSFNDESAWKDRVYTSDRFRRGSATQEPLLVSGYVAVEKGIAFTLANGKWIRSKSRPTGFMVSSPDEEFK